MKSSDEKSPIRKRTKKLIEKLSGKKEAPGRSALSRRSFIQVGAVAGTAAAFGGVTAAVSSAAPQSAQGQNNGNGKGNVPTFLNEATILQLQTEMASGRLSAIDILNFYVERINALNPQPNGLNAVIEVNPDAFAIADALDKERAQGHVRGPLHGIPVLLKDNIDTHDKMQTAAGSLALVGTPPLQDATVAARLRAAGAILLGKATLSEWANFRSSFSSSGWSGRGGQCNNPYALDRNPSGSSSGSGAGVSANFTAVALATETDGSIISPANNNGICAIKPTVGLTSRGGVVPISHNQDTVGPHGRTVSDVATVLGALVGVDSRDPATAASAGHFFTDYTQFLDPNGLKGARIGVPRNGFQYPKPDVDAIFEDALQALRDAGATVIDPAEIPSIDAIFSSSDEFTVLLFDFKDDLNAYLATRVGVPIKTLADAIAFNSASNIELKFFGQDIFISAEATDGLSDPAYIAALANDQLLGRAQGIDAALAANNLDALVAPSGGPGWTTDLLNGDHFVFGSTTVSAIAGYPIVGVPMGNYFGMPVSMSFMGTAWSEPKLIKLAYAFEQATKARIVPQLFDHLPFDSGGPFAKLTGKPGKVDPREFGKRW